jgi:hypothetical protein
MEEGYLLEMEPPTTCIVEHVSVWGGLNAQQILIRAREQGDDKSNHCNKSRLFCIHFLLAAFDTM